jgi:glycosyltransferase involved in cell wall biosynthesis
LIKTVPLLKEKFQDDFKLLIVGEFYEGRDDILQLIEELNVADRILLMDRYVPNEEVEKYFRAADVGILPYESATQSGIIQIAHDFGLPVITTNVGGLPEVVHHETTGFLVPPGDPKALADAVFRYYDGDWEAQFRTALEQEKSHYSWEPLIQTIEEAAGTGWQ